MLQPDPAQATRLAEVITNLHERIREATERGKAVPLGLTPSPVQPGIAGPADH
jgi:hypothetical protein